MSTLSEIETAVHQLPQADKLRLMEALWEGLSRKEEWVSPAWHGEILAETERRLAEGKEDLMDWEQAKKKLRSGMS